MLAFSTGYVKHTPEVKKMSTGLEEMAKAVAVEDKTLRDRIYAKCLEKFDGETNVLWQQLEADGDMRSKGGWSRNVDDLVDAAIKQRIKNEKNRLITH